MSPRRLQLARARVHRQAERFECLRPEDGFGPARRDQCRVPGLAAEQTDDHRPDPHGAAAAIGQLDSDPAWGSDDAEVVREVGRQNAVRSTRIDEDAHARRALPGQLCFDEDVPHGESKS